MSYEIRAEGVLGQDAKFKEGVSKTGKAYELLSFSIAPSFKRGEEWKSEWMNVTAFGHLAKKHMNLAKKDKVWVEGEYYETLYEGKVQKNLRATKILHLCKPGVPLEELPNAQPAAEVLPGIDEIPF